MGSVRPRAFLSVLAATSIGVDAYGEESVAQVPELGEMMITARRIPERDQIVPVAITTLSAERIANYNITSLERVAEITPGLIITRGNSGSGADFSLRGIGSNFSSIGIEQSVAVVVDGVYYGQGRVIDASFLDIERIEILKGPQALYFGKNSTAGVISITTADPSDEFEARARLGYEFESRSPSGEAVLSGSVTDTVALRLAVGGQNMGGGYVYNDAGPGTYTTIDAATGTATAHAVSAPAERDLPADKSWMGRFTASYEPSDSFNATLKVSGDHNEQGGAAWNDRQWQCPSGASTFPGNPPEPCGESFRISQNPAPLDIARTREDMGREGGEPYTLYDAYAATAHIESVLPRLMLTSLTNYQTFDYSSSSDYDFTSIPSIWADQNNTYRALSQEFRAQTRFDTPLNFLLGVYYQDTHLDFSRAAVFFGSENSLVTNPTDRYVSVLKRSETDGSTWAGYGQLIWNFLPEWELTAGGRYTAETKDSYFTQPYVNPFFALLYRPNGRLAANQHFDDFSPQATLTWRPDETLTFYVSYREGYKSGGFSNSANDVIGGGGVDDLAFQPETVDGFEAGAKAVLFERRMRLAANVYRYDFSDLQVDFFNAQSFALITTNAGSAISEGVELEAEYLPPALNGLKLRGTVAYNRARYEDYIGPCYTGQTQAQGCNIIGNEALQDLSGEPTADSPRWSASTGVDYQHGFGAGLWFGASVDARYSDVYSVSPFAQPLDRQDAYVNLDASLRLGAENRRWQLALIGKNLTNNFIVTYASDMPATGTPAGGVTGRLADQFALFAAGRTVALHFTYQH